MLTVVGILNINHSQKPLFLLGTFVQDLFSFVDEIKHHVNLRGVSAKLNKYIVFTMQTYKELINFC